MIIGAQALLGLMFFVILLILKYVINISLMKVK